MCLITANPSIVAQRDIECYKLLIKNDVGNTSPYIRASYRIPSTVTDATIIERVAIIPRGSHIEYHVSEGFLHCYRYLHTVERVNEVIFHEENTVIVKCIIPKGTLCYYNDREICAKQLKLIEICV